MAALRHKQDFSAKGSFTKQVLYLSIAKSDKIILKRARKLPRKPQNCEFRSLKRVSPAKENFNWLKRVFPICQPPCSREKM